MSHSQGTWKRRKKNKSNKREKSLKKSGIPAALSHFSEGARRQAGVNPR